MQLRGPRDIVISVIFISICLTPKHKNLSSVLSSHAKNQAWQSLFIIPALARKRQAYSWGFVATQQSLLHEPQVLETDFVLQKKDRKGGRKKRRKEGGRERGLERGNWWHLSRKGIRSWTLLTSFLPPHTWAQLCALTHMQTYRITLLRDWDEKLKKNLEVIKDKRLYPLCIESLIAQYFIKKPTSKKWTK